MIATGERERGDVMEKADMEKVVAAYESRGSKTLVEVAEEYGVKPGTLSNWASRSRKKTKASKSKKNGDIRWYSEDAKRKAVEACRNRGTMSIRQVAEKQGVPYGTLRDWVEGRHGAPKPLVASSAPTNAADAVRVAKEGLELLGRQIAKKVFTECTELGQTPAEFSKTFVAAIDAKSLAQPVDARHEDLLKQNERLSQDLRTVKVKIDLILRVLTDVIKDIE